MRWADFDNITIKQLKMFIKKRHEQSKIKSELRSLEHYKAFENAYRKSEEPYKKLHPDLEEEVKKEKPNVKAAIEMLKEVGINVNSISS